MDKKDTPGLEALQKLVQSLAFFGDLGVEQFVLTPARRQGRQYRALAGRRLRRPAPPATAGKADPQASPEKPVRPASAAIAKPAAAAASPIPASPQPAAPPHQASLLEAAAPAPPRLSREEKVRQLAALRREIGECTRCKLCRGRQTVVFGEGNPEAALMFVGEGPGADEDATGRPFVGKAGQLLDKMIRAMTLQREEVYIANVVKCRPPGNRTPEPDEVAACGPFLIRQIEIIQPRVIVCLGAPAAQFLLDSRKSIGLLRGTVGRCHGAQVIPTYHPAYLLRGTDREARAKTWADLQKAMALLGLSLPPKSR
jgi:DNA polymerase